MLFQASPAEIAGTVLFACALIHTFCTAFFSRLSHRFPSHRGIFHLLGEVEVVFGCWAFLLFAVLTYLNGYDTARHYVETRQFTEPLFVCVIMVMAASRPIVSSVQLTVQRFSRLIPLPQVLSGYALALGGVPLLGSLMTEPAAMTLAALSLHQGLFKHPAASALPERFRYFTLGVLCVNISIGGTLTHFAAPPVLMVASTWGWDTPFMALNFGLKASLAVWINTLIATLWLAHLLRGKTENPVSSLSSIQTIPLFFRGIHFVLLGAVVFTSHHPVLFIGIFLFFLGLAHAYPRFHDRLMLKEGLLVGFFLAGLVVLGGLQTWWLQPVLSALSPTAVFAVSTGLTAITDNAAITYLGSQLTGLSNSFKYALVAGAVAGGGLTLIANAPNPAGAAILRSHFSFQTISVMGLLKGAALPTLVAILCFQGL